MGIYADWFILRCKFFFPSVLCIILPLILCACTDGDVSNVALNESEIFFGDEMLSSVSRDSLEQSQYYIGTEDGNIYLYNSDKNQLNKLTTEADRIYKVVRSIAGNDTIYWIGTRNQGLWRCKREGNNLVRMKDRGQFLIPAENKESMYSAYDISIHESGIYIASSHGLLKVPDDTCRILKVLYPNDNIIRKDPSCLRPLVVGNITRFNAESLVCSSDSGLLVVDLKSDNVEVLLRRQKIWNVVAREHEVYALTSNSSVKVLNMNNGQCDSFKTKYPAQIYYYEELEGINYFISDNKVQLVKDQHLRNPSLYHAVPLRRGVRTKCHNLIVNDSKNCQSLLVTNHTLTRIGHHQDIFNTTGSVKLACVDAKNIYYLIGEKLYCQRTDSEEPMEAYHIKDITGGTKDVRFMEVKKDVLYYVDSENRVFMTRLQNSYFANSAISVFSKDKMIEPSLNRMREITSIGKDSNNVYVGVRDGFRNVAELDKNIELKRSATESTPDPFITVFAQTLTGETVIGTLNDGLFIGRDNRFNQIRNTYNDDYKFTRDIAIDKKSGDLLYVLTNKRLLQPGDTTTAAGFYKLLLTDDNRLYGIRNYGIHDFNTDTDYFVDIQFQPRASVTLGDKVYASSSNGVFVLSSSLTREKERGIGEGYKLVKFHTNTLFSRINMILALLFLLGITCCILLITIYRRSARVISAKKGRTIKRILEYKSAEQWLEEDTRVAIEQLLTETNEVNVRGGRKAYLLLKDIDDKIINLASRITDNLLSILKKQINQLNEYKGEKRVDENITKSEGMKAGVDILLILSQVDCNGELLRRLKESDAILEVYNALFEDPSKAPWRLYDDDVCILLKSNCSHREKIRRVEELISQLPVSSLDYMGRTNGNRKLSMNDEMQDSVIRDILKNIEADRTLHVDKLTMSNDHNERIEALISLQMDNKRFFLVEKLCEIDAKIIDIYGHLDKLRRQKNSNTENKDEIEEERKKVERKRADLYRLLRHLSDEFNRCLKDNTPNFQFSHQDDMELLSLLGVNAESQEGRLLPLITCNSMSMIPKSDYCEIVIGERTSVSRANGSLAAKIKKQKNELNEYGIKYPTSIARLILCCKIL